MGEAMKRKQAKLDSLRRLRFMISVIVIIGAALSVVLNVQHAPKVGGWVAQMVGGFPPVAVFLCIELMTRVPVLKRLPAVVRILATAAVSVLAGWVSYEQQYEFIHRLGFTGRTAAMFPLIIDGTMLVATVSLAEVSSQIRALLSEIADIEAAAEESATVVSAVEVVPPQRKPGPNEQTRQRRVERARRAEAPHGERPGPGKQGNGQPAKQQRPRASREPAAPVAPVVVVTEPEPVPASA